MKKTLVFLMVLTLLATCMGGLFTVANAEGVDHSEYYELTYYMDACDPRMAEMMNSNSFQQAIKEKFNMNIRLLPFPGDMQEFTATKLAAGDYPDVVRLFNRDIITAYVEADALVDLNPLMEQYGQDFKARNEQYFAHWKSIAGNKDDHIWLFSHWEPDPGYTVSNVINEFFVRTDILEQQGYPAITNTDDLLNVLAKGLEDNPETDGLPTLGLCFPMAWGETGMTVIQSIYQLSGITYAETNGTVQSVYDAETDSFVELTSQPQYKEGMRFWNKAWRNGVLDRESVTDSYDSYKDKLLQGRALAGYFVSAWELADINNQLAAAGKPYRYMTFPTVLPGETQRVSVMESPSAWLAMGITKNCKYPERVMEVLNFIASEEGRLLVGWGVEGVQYEIDPETGLRVPTQEHLDKTASDPDYALTWGGPFDFGFIPDLDANGQCYLMRQDSNFVAKTLDPVVKATMAAYGWENVYEMYRENGFTLSNRQKGFKANTPTLDDEQDFLAENISELRTEAALAMIIAEDDETFEAIYQNMQDERAQMGVQTLVDLWNAEYAELVGAYDAE